MNAKIGNTYPLWITENNHSDKVLIQKKARSKHYRVKEIYESTDVIHEFTTESETANLIQAEHQFSISIKNYNK
jgi:hypothetical protein